MIKKLLILFMLSTLIFGTSAGLSIADQSNHGQVVSDVAKSTEPGSQHGPIVSEAARNKSNNDYALSFDGVDDYVKILHDNIFNLEDSFTLESWVKSTAQNVYILNKHVSGSVGGYHFFVYPSGAGIDAGYFVNGSTLVNDSEWHHIAAVLDKANNVFNLYVDGYLDQSNSLTGERYPINTKSLEIGAMTTVPWFGTQTDLLGEAKLDEIRVWNKALTQEEVKANMYNEVHPQRGLVAYWKFDEGFGTTTEDSSVYGKNDGILINGPTWTTDTPF